MVFNEWNDGDANNPRIVNLVSDTAFEAIFVTAVCDTITQFPWNIEFSENMFNCWDNFSTIGGMPWLQVLTIMASMQDEAADDVDNWLVTPWVIPETNTSLFYTCRSFQGDSMAVVAITSSGDSVTISDDFLPAGNIEIHADLTRYAGQPVRLALHHHASVNSGGLMLTAARIDYLQGISQIENSKVRITTSGLTLTVNNPEGETVRIYDITGRQLKITNSQLSTTNLPVSGVYIVKVGNLPARKVVAIR